MSSRLFEKKLFRAIDRAMSKAIDRVFEEEFGSLDSSSSEEAVGDSWDLSDSSDSLELSDSSDSMEKWAMAPKHEVAVGDGELKVIILIDSSASMTLDKIDGKDRWQRTIAWLANWKPWPMTDEAKFQMWTFATNPVQVYPAAGGWGKLKAADWSTTVCAFNQASNSGTTKTKEAISAVLPQYAEKDRNLMFVLTDGVADDPVCPTHSADGLAQSAKKIGAYVFGVDTGTALQNEFGAANCFPNNWKDITSSQPNLPAVKAAMEAANSVKCDACNRKIQNGGDVVKKAAAIDCTELGCTLEGTRDAPTGCKVTDTVKNTGISTNAAPQFNANICGA